MSSPVWSLPIYFDSGPNSPCSYAILFFTASEFTSITSHIRNWVLISLWLHPFILSGVISPLISSSILGTYQPGQFILQCHIFLPFHTVHIVLKARMLKWFATPFSSGPPDVKSPFIRKGPDIGKDWRQEEKGITEDKMVGLHHRLNGHECERALGDSEGQGSLACCSPWSHDWATEQQQQLLFWSRKHSKITIYNALLVTWPQLHKNIDNINIKICQRKFCSLLFSPSVVPDSFSSPWTVSPACQAPLSMEFPRQEYWSWLSF